MMFTALIMLISASGGEVLNRCWGTESDHSKIIECQARERKALRAEMHALLSKQKEVARNDAAINQKTLDKLAEEMGEKIAYASLPINHVQILETSQKVFEEYVYAECGRQAHRYSGGTFAADAEIACEIDLLQQRIAVLSASFNKPREAEDDTGSTENGD